MDHLENDMRGRQDETRQNEEQRKLEEDRRVEEQRKRDADLRATEIAVNRGKIAEELSKDLKKVTPPTFSGKTLGDDAKAWIISLEKYFHV
jgi:hypothetical protein